MFLPEAEEPKNVKILVVDDDASTRENLKEILSLEGYQVYTAENGKEALEMLSHLNPDIMVVDLFMPELDGISLCKIVKNNTETVDIGIILITAANDIDSRIKGLAGGADDFLNKPFLIPELKARIASLSKIKKYRDFLKNYQNLLEREVEKKTSELQKLYLQLQIAYNEIKDLSLEIIYRLAKAAEFKDEYTGFHIQRIGFYSTKIAEHLGLSKEQVELIKYSSPLHDIGKLRIPDHILLKPGPLTKDEWEIMKTHTIMGAKILEGSKIKYLKAAEKIALLHHEKWDGTGYPYGLKGKKIPLFARIVSIADVFDALTSDRPYRKAFSVEEAFEIIKNESGKHFDPELVEIFLKIKDEIIEIRTLFKDEKNNLSF
ncbi:response regulator receiver modulated metal dependent phosphohydrolase [Thermodesulfobacterium geofontis OPF15]|jgi:putative two-component system response regulator|uniref:Response regulator receiver modulated metal dependent phosphohydrolase n=1 Tax=Thermodesulfobacterium geofontis (strain OPF15) TaxID=795359 RepID=F8C2D9_THEGP|nr:two-component system response regulator [Thermodesulfobacterium geofontis]AEH22229.1 response regulator receiver modulated metal dependent phosphohydrolase [Thermodesulfobacterium geofontis OPF15]